MENQTKKRQVIINNPYEEPKKYHKRIANTTRLELTEGRRPAGYQFVKSQRESIDEKRIVTEYTGIEIELVNMIRPIVKEWRSNHFQGVTPTTRKLLEYWENHTDPNPFFFCQRDAIHTLIWLNEIYPVYHKDLKLPIGSDGSLFQRLCTKMATGTGKTFVISMLIAYHVLNAVHSHANDKRFCKYILVVAPGLTVKERLDVLKLSNKDNYYQKYHIIPDYFLSDFSKGKIVIENWHSFSPFTADDPSYEEIKSVDKRGKKSDFVIASELLKDLDFNILVKKQNRQILVINDEAHHAWRMPQSKIKVDKDEQTEATIWMQGLDAIHKLIPIKTCYDFSATPFISGASNAESSLFTWIVSDFGLDDAIESGLVKTPLFVVKDDAIPKSGKNFNKSRLYHIYDDEDVRDDLNRKKTEAHEALPSLIKDAYQILSAHWLETYQEWQKAQPNHKEFVPPVMISVVNKTDTADRLMHFLQNPLTTSIPNELTNLQNVLQIDSKTLAKAEKGDPLQGIEKQNADLLRLKMNTVGQKAQAGQYLTHLISVNMLAEGWDAKTVTHIMGLRAFSSQLLCEQVIGRGLRRRSYELNKDGLLDPEYVNIFGVPFDLMLCENAEDMGIKSRHATIVKPPKEAIFPLQEREQDYCIQIPNVRRFELTYDAILTINFDDVSPLELKQGEKITQVGLSTALAGTTFDQLTEIDLNRLFKEDRLQTIIYKTASHVYQKMNVDWQGNKALLMAQVVKITEQFLELRDKITITPPIFSHLVEYKAMILLHMDKIIEHLWHSIRYQNTQKRVPIFDTQREYISSHQIPIWYTTKNDELYATQKSHLNYCVCDSTWEHFFAKKLDQDDTVKSWIKNDKHLGFTITYFDSTQQKYREYYPDFIVFYKNNHRKIYEVKGKMTQSDLDKQKAIQNWVESINQDGRFGKWQFEMIEQLA